MSKQPIVFPAISPICSIIHNALKFVLWEPSLMVNYVAVALYLVKIVKVPPKIALPVSIQAFS